VLDRADDLAKLPIQDEQGQTIELGSLWRDKPVAIVFLRHFG
jgi:hypothetical protein